MTMFSGKRTMLSSTIAVFAVLAIAIGSSFASSEVIKETSSPVKVTMAARAAGGASQLFGEAVGESIRRKIPGSSFTYEPGRDAPNCVSAAIGRTELGMTNYISAMQALKGEPPFDKAYKDIRGVFNLFTLYYTFVIAKDIDIATIGDLKKKKYPLKLAVNQKDSIMEMANRIALKAHGITYADIEKWGGKIYYINFKQSFDMMKDRRLDAVAAATQAPTAAIIEAATTTPMKMVKIDAELLQQVAKEMGGYVDKIPKEAYAFLDEAVPSVTTNTVIVTSATQSNDLIYTITKAMLENEKYIQSVHSDLKRFTPAYAGSMGDLPLHPGAKKCFQEFGVIPK